MSDTSEDVDLSAFDDPAVRAHQYERHIAARDAAPEYVLYQTLARSVVHAIECRRVLVAKLTKHQDAILRLYDVLNALALEGAAEEFPQFSHHPDAIRENRAVLDHLAVVALPAPDVINITRVLTAWDLAADWAEASAIIESDVLAAADKRAALARLADAVQVHLGRPQHVRLVGMSTNLLVLPKHLSELQARKRPVGFPGRIRYVENERAAATDTIGRLATVARAATDGVVSIIERVRAYEAALCVMARNAQSHALSYAAVSAAGEDVLL